MVPKPTTAVLGNGVWFVAMETSCCRCTLIPWQLCLLRTIFSDIIKIWSRSDLITISAPRLYFILGLGALFFFQRLPRNFVCFLCWIIVYSLKYVNLAWCHINLQWHFSLLQNCFIKRKLLIIVYFVLTDVNIFQSIVLANTYIRDINKAYHLPTNGVYNINKCQCSLTSILYCNAFPNCLSCKHSNQ